MGGDLVTRNLGESKRESANSRTSSGDENPRGFRPIWRCTMEVLGWSQFVSPVQCLGYYVRLVVVLESWARGRRMEMETHGQGAAATCSNDDISLGIF